MKKGLASALLILGIGLSPLVAKAGWSVFGDLEHFRWAEDTAPSVTETGPRLGIGVEWAKDRPVGWQFRYHGRFYFGSVDYQGSLLLGNTPITGTTDYSGMTHEAQEVYRFPSSPLGAELVSGLGLDLWRRQLTAVQSEDYSVVYLRLGANLDRHARTGWHGGAGVKLPLSVAEDAHFPDIGFQPNPRLSPKGEASFYAEAGYRFDERWSLRAYYDSYRFGESNRVAVVEAGTGIPFTFIQPKSSLDALGLRLDYRF